MDCFSNFDRVRGWFDTEFQDSDGFTVSRVYILDNTTECKISVVILNISWVHVHVYHVKFCDHSRLGIRKPVLVPQESRVSIPLGFSQ